MSVVLKLKSLVIDYLKANKKEERLLQRKATLGGWHQVRSNTLLDSVTCAFPKEMQGIWRLSSKDL